MVHVAKTRSIPLRASVKANGPSLFSARFYRVSLRLLPRFSLPFPFGTLGVPIIIAAGEMIPREMREKRSRFYYVFDFLSRS